MGFRAVVSTQDYARSKTWPEWFVGKWGETCHITYGTTLITSKMEIKNVSGFVNDYAKALSEIGWEFFGGHTKTPLTVAIHWECGGVTRVRIWGVVFTDQVGGKVSRTYIVYTPEDWYSEHSDGCECCERES